MAQHAGQSPPAPVRHSPPVPPARGQLERITVDITRQWPATRPRPQHVHSDPSSFGPSHIVTGATNSIVYAQYRILCSSGVNPSICNVPCGRGGERDSRYGPAPRDRTTSLPRPAVARTPHRSARVCGGGETRGAASTIHQPKAPIYEPQYPLTVKPTAGKTAFARGRRPHRFRPGADKVDADTPPA